jgi:hypothetical protein
VVTTKNIVTKPTKKNVIPPKKPRFSKIIASAKQAKADGSPVPIETPKKNEISTFTDASLFGIVASRTETTAPVSIHRQREILLERGKNIAPIIAELATAK